MELTKGLFVGMKYKTSSIACLPCTHRSNSPLLCKFQFTIGEACSTNCRVVIVNAKMILELIPISTLLAVLTTQLLETAIAAQDVLIEKDTFRLLSKYLGDIQPLLADLSSHNMKESQASRQALESLKEDIRNAKKLVDTCTSKTRIYLLVNCRSIVKDAQQVTRDIGKSLALLSLASAEVSVDIQDNVDRLKDEMLRAEFQASESKIQIINKLERGLREHKTDQGFANDLIREIARAVGIPVEASEISKELASFKREKEEAAERKERDEEAFMEQIIALLSRADAAHTPESIRESYKERVNSIGTLASDEEIPVLHTFLCPLKGEVMVDPVSLVNSQTYEREEIVKWFQGGHITDPVTKEELTDFTLRPNNPIKQAIEEWVERNYCIRIQKAKKLLQAGDESEQQCALDELCDLCKKSSMNKQWIAMEGMIVDIIVTLKSHHKEVKKKSLSTLCVLAIGNDQIKDQIVETGGVEQVVRCLAREITVAKAALALLLELLQTGPSKNRQVYNKLSQERSAILLLVTLLNGKNAEAAQHAKLILEQLGDKEQNVVQMAKANWYAPLIDQLCKGPDEAKLIMAKALTSMELTEQNKMNLGEEGAILPLIKMISGPLESKAAALGALQNLSSFGPNKRKIAEAGAVPVVLEHLFSARYPLIVREFAAAILEKLSAADGTKFFLDASGAPIELEHTIHSLLAVQENASSSSTVRRHVLLSLLGMVSSPDGKEARKIMRLANGIQMLLPLLESSDREICSSVVQLLHYLSEEGAQEITDFINRKGKVGFFVGLLQDDSRGDVQAAAAGVLANISLGDTVLTRSFIEEGALPAIVHVLRCGNFKAKENAVGALLRFTNPLDIILQRKVVEMGIFPILISMINSGTTLAKTRAAYALSNLSQSTMQLSNPPSLSGCFFIKKKTLPVCRVHLGQCTERTTFCLVEAEAVSGLVTLLNERESDAAGAGVDALSTLVFDDDILEKGAGLLHEVRAIDPVLELISQGTEGSKEKAIHLLERLFTLKWMVNQYGTRAKIPLVDLATHGNGLRKKAARVLAQLEAIHEVSAYF